MKANVKPPSGTRAPLAVQPSRFPSFINSARSDSVLLSENSETKVFLKWAKEAGIVSGKLAPALFNGLRGLAAIDAVKAGDILISVPRKSSVLVTPRMRCPFPDFVDRDYWERCTWYMRLALQLLHQKREAQEGGTPRLSGYLAQLPTHVDLPVQWGDPALQALQYPSLIHLVRATESRSRRQAIHNRVVHHVIAICITHCHSGLTLLLATCYTPLA